ncbi:hypothetical protein E3N88_42355 [Mikania micrantha]|uniref:Uncharacterized protein n=1 Tax=Mikania micrantha TaxID=192012 RepID=A0A5N6LI48_9ASTR|nr:hypothetical protein E3N88_42355 [Mikania micrantha]
MFGFNEVRAGLNRSCTPLHWSAIRGKLEACTVLVQAGKKDDLMVTDNIGYTPAQLASDNNHRQVAFFLGNARKLYEKRYVGTFGRLSKLGLAPALLCNICSTFDLYQFSHYRSISAFCAIAVLHSCPSATPETLSVHCLRQHLTVRKMIKRRFYKQEHGDKDVPSDSSSSSSDSELDAEASVDTEDDDNNMVMESKKKDEPSLSSSGYESEDSSANEVNLDSSGSPTNDDDSGYENAKRAINGSHLSAYNNFDMGIAQSTDADNDAMTNNALDCVLKSKSVFKCKLCPRIVCLTEETLKAHLKSKRHARSEKLLKEGRLKMMLNSDGEIEELEEDGQTHQERHAATLALAESNKNSTKDSRKNKGRQRQRKRLKKKTSDDLMSMNTKKPVKRSAKKRRKSDP